MGIYMQSYIGVAVVAAALRAQGWCTLTARSRFKEYQGSFNCILIDVNEELKGHLPPFAFAIIVLYSTAAPQAQGWCGLTTRSCFKVYQGPVI
jgi:hypothetical protein